MPSPTGPRFESTLQFIDLAQSWSGVLVLRAFIQIWWPWQLAFVPTSSCTSTPGDYGRTRYQTSWTLSRRWQGNSHKLHEPYRNVRSFIMMLLFCSRLALNWQPWRPQTMPATVRSTTGPGPRSAATDTICHLANQLRHSSVGISAWLVSTLVYCFLGMGQGV